MHGGHLLTRAIDAGRSLKHTADGATAPLPAGSWRLGTHLETESMQNMHARVDDWHKDDSHHMCCLHVPLSKHFP